MNWDKIFDVIVNKIHIALAAVCQGTILFYQMHTGHDVQPGVQNTVYAYYAFLAGHNFTNQKYQPNDDDAAASDPTTTTPKTGSAGPKG